MDAVMNILNAAGPILAAVTAALAPMAVGYVKRVVKESDAKWDDKMYRAARKAVKDEVLEDAGSQ